MYLLLEGAETPARDFNTPPSHSPNCHPVFQQTAFSFLASSLRQQKYSVWQPAFSTLLAYHWKNLRVLITHFSHLFVHVFLCWDQAYFTRSLQRICSAWNEPPSVALSSSSLRKPEKFTSDQPFLGFPSPAWRPTPKGHIFRKESRELPRSWGVLERTCGRCGISLFDRRDFCLVR